MMNSNVAQYVWTVLYSVSQQTNKQTNKQTKQTPQQTNTPTNNNNKPKQTTNRTKTATVFINHEPCSLSTYASGYVIATVSNIVLQNVRIIGSKLTAI